MRKCIALLACFLFLCTAVGCDSYYDWVTDVEEGLEPVDLDSVEVLHHIRITAGERVLTGVLYDTDTAKAFAAMLPLTVKLWNAAPTTPAAIDESQDAGGQEDAPDGKADETADEHADVVGTESEDAKVSGAESEQADASGKENASVKASGEKQGSNVLIAYFSMPEDVDTSGVDAVAGASIVVRENEALGNTQYVAEIVQQTIGGELFRIETVQQYPLDHDPLVDQAAEEQDADVRPELATHIENPEQCDTIVLGFPNWWGDLPQPLYTFLEEYDFSGKTIIPFVTHGGSGFSNTRDTIAGLQPGATVSENTLSLSRNDVADSEADVAAWAQSLGL